MDWLRTHEYLAVWLSLPLMVILAIFQQLRGKGRPVSIARMALYFAFITCIAVAATPTSDELGRTFAIIASLPLFLAVAYHADQDLKDARQDKANEKISTNT